MLDTTFKRNAAAAIMAACATLSFQVSADDKQCSPLKEVNGHTANARVSAYLASEENIGEVSIWTIPGEDVGNEEKLESGGTQFVFYVAGNAIQHNGETQFGIKDLMSNKSILRGIADEAQVARMLITQRQNSTPTLVASNPE